MTQKQVRMMIAGGVLAALGVGYGLARVRAEGVPTSQPLWYSGTVADLDGKPLETNNYDISFNLYTQAEGQVGETPVCPTVTTAATRVVSGRFRIDVSTCAAALQANPDLFVELAIDGGRPFARAKVGAVPFALEAARASGATGELAAQLVPSGAVMAFELEACPVGWVAIASARGRTIIGANPSTGGGLSARTVGATLGDETHTLTVAEMPAHTHRTEIRGQTGYGFNNNDRDLFWNGGAGVQSNYGVSRESLPVGGGQAMSIMPPSLVLLYCKKR